jgi:uncharacterized membrane-anchored protein
LPVPNKLKNEQKTRFISTYWIASSHSNWNVCEGTLSFVGGQGDNIQNSSQRPTRYFRGNYVVLNYDFNRLDLDSIKNNDIDSTTLANFNFGDKLFLELKPKGKYYETVGVWQEKPQTDNICMQVIVQSKPYSRNIEVKAGIESYFTTTNNAKSLEKATSWAAQDSVEVSVAICVASNGAARIKEVLVKSL